MKILYTSGLQRQWRRPGQDRWRDAYLQKPYAMESLARTLRELLDSA